MRLVVDIRDERGYNPTRALEVQERVYDEAPLKAQDAEDERQYGQADHRPSRVLLHRIQQLFVVLVHAVLALVILLALLILSEPFSLPRDQLNHPYQHEASITEPCSHHEPPLHLQVFAVLVVLLGDVLAQRSFNCLKKLLGRPY